MNLSILKTVAIANHEVFCRLLQDYTSFVIPNSVRYTLRGHEGNVKCVRFIGEEGRRVVSGSR